MGAEISLGTDERTDERNGRTDISKLHKNRGHYQLYRDRVNLCAFELGSLKWLPFENRLRYRNVMHTVSKRRLSSFCSCRWSKTNCVCIQSFLVCMCSRKNCYSGKTVICLDVSLLPENGYCKFFVKYNFCRQKTTYLSKSHAKNNIKPNLLKYLWKMLAKAYTYLLQSFSPHYIQAF